MIIGAAILNYNGREMLLQSLASLKAATRVPDRICVVDNASTDGSAAAVHAAHPDVHVIELSRNLGGPAINAGFEWLASQGCDVFWKLDNDIEVDPRCVEYMEAAARQQPCAILSPIIFFAEPPGKVWFAGGRVDWIKMQCNQHFESVEPFRQLPQRERFITGCAQWIPVEVVRTIGGYDPMMFLYGDDIDFSIRAAKAGFPMDVVADARLVHHIHASSGGPQKPNPARLYHILRTTFLMWRKHLGFWGFHRRWCRTNLWPWLNRHPVWWQRDENLATGEAIADALWFYLSRQRDVTVRPPSPPWFRNLLRQRSWAVGAALGFDLPTLLGWKRNPLVP